jgi:hypothetical protein
MNDTETDLPLREHDMYGHKITPIGDGFGVSVSLGRYPDGAVLAHLAVFHESDGFRQSLLACMVDGKPHIANIFPDRLAEVLLLLKEEAKGQ